MLAESAGFGEPGQAVVIITEDGAQHVEAVRRLGYVDVIAIAGSNLARARASAEELHIERAYGTYAELLADPDIDVIHNCTPNVLHYVDTKLLWR